MRTALGVIMGYLFFAAGAIIIFAVSGREPHAAAETGFMIVSTIGGMAAALLAGLIAASVSGRGDRRASLLLAAVIALGAIISMLTLPPGGHRWSMISAIVFMAPSAIAGGIIYERLQHLHAG